MSQRRRPRRDIIRTFRQIRLGYRSPMVITRLLCSSNQDPICVILRSLRLRKFKSDNCYFLFMLYIVLSHKSDRLFFFRTIHWDKNKMTQITRDKSWVRMFETKLSFFIVKLKFLSDTFSKLICIHLTNNWQIDKFYLQKSNKQKK